MSLFSRLAYVGKVLTGQRPREKEVKRIKRIADSLKRKGYIFTERFSPSEYSYDVLRSIGEDWLKSHVMELSKPDIIAPTIPEPIIPKVPEPIKVSEEIQKAYEKGIYMANKYNDLTRVSEALGIDRDVIANTGDEYITYGDDGHIVDFDEGMVLLDEINKKMRDWRDSVPDNIIVWFQDQLAELTDIDGLVKRVKENSKHFWTIADALEGYSEGNGTLQDLCEEFGYLITGERPDFHHRKG